MRFYCATGAVQSVFSSMVNDGVCDCADASDEWASGAACATPAPNRKTAHFEHIGMAF